MSTPKINEFAGACVTDEFRRAFGEGGCSHIVCICGRDNGEPDGEEAVMVLNLGPLVADGCECGAGPRHESWVWAHRAAIAEYLTTRGKRELEEAQRTAAANLASLDALAALGNLS